MKRISHMLETNQLGTVCTNQIIALFKSPRIKNNIEIPIISIGKFLYSNREKIEDKNYLITPISFQEKQWFANYKTATPILTYFTDCFSTNLTNVQFRNTNFWVGKGAIFNNNFEMLALVTCSFNFITKTPYKITLNISKQAYYDDHIVNKFITNKLMNYYRHNLQQIECDTIINTTNITDIEVKISNFKDTVINCNDSEVLSQEEITPIIQQNKISILDSLC